MLIPVAATIVNTTISRSAITFCGYRRNAINKIRIDSFTSFGVFFIHPAGPNVIGLPIAMIFITIGIIVFETTSYYITVYHVIIILFNNNPRAYYSRSELLHPYPINFDNSLEYCFSRLYFFYRSKTTPGP